MIKIYRAAWTIRSGSLAVFQVVLLIGFAVFTFILLPSFASLFFELDGIRRVLAGILPMLMIGGVCMWLYGLLTVFVGGYSLSFVDDVLEWRTTGAIIPTRQAIPLRDIMSLRHVGEVAEFHRLQIRTRTKGYGIYPIMSEKDVTDLMATIGEQAEAAGAGCAVKPVLRFKV